MYAHPRESSSWRTMHLVTWSGIDAADDRRRDKQSLAEAVTLCTLAWQVYNKMLDRNMHWNVGKRTWSRQKPAGNWNEAYDVILTSATSYFVNCGVMLASIFIKFSNYWSMEDQHFFEIKLKIEVICPFNLCFLNFKQTDFKILARMIQ